MRCLYTPPNGQVCDAEWCFICGLLSVECKKFNTRKCTAVSRTIGKPAPNYTKEKRTY